MSTFAFALRRFPRVRRKLPNRRTNSSSALLDGVTAVQGRVPAAAHGDGLPWPSDSREAPPGLAVSDWWQADAGFAEKNTNHMTETNDMTSLTVREKEHWKERITRKIDQAIESLYSLEKPTFLEEIDRDARKRAIESLGLTEAKNRVEELDEQRTRIDREKIDLYRQMHARIAGKSVEEIRAQHYSEPYEVGAAVNRRAAVHRREILAATEVGRQVIELEREKEELLDTVWLATSGAHIKQLWSKVTDILQQQPTPFQQKALEIEAVAND